MTANNRQKPYSHFVSLKKNLQHENIYDVEMAPEARLNRLSSLECHFVIYPYSRKVCSDHITFYPFEEYVKDILSRQKSAYEEIPSHFGKLFGLLIGVLIVLLFYFINPADLFSVGSLISLLGAYFIGKELWDDLENFLINISKGKKIRYMEDYYSYRSAGHDTLTNYSRFAKSHRYGTIPLLPDKMDFIAQSNSQTLRLYFGKKKLPGEMKHSRHLFSIHIDELEEFIAGGFFFGMKLSLNRRFLWFTWHHELFQFLHREERGCLDKTGNWLPGAIFYRKALSLGRLKFFFKQGTREKESILAKYE